MSSSLSIRNKNIFCVIPTIILDFLNRQIDSWLDIQISKFDGQMYRYMYRKIDIKKDRQIAIIYIYRLVTKSVLSQIYKLIVIVLQAIHLITNYFVVKKIKVNQYKYINLPSCLQFVKRPRVIQIFLSIYCHIYLSIYLLIPLTIYLQFVHKA